MAVAVPVAVPVAAVAMAVAVGQEIAVGQMAGVVADFPAAAMLPFYPAPRTPPRNPVTLQDLDIARNAVTMLKVICSF